MQQNKGLQQITDKELKISLILSQGLFLLISIIASLFIFDHFFDWFYLFMFHPKEIILYGIVPGLVIVIIDIALINMLPARHFDDGGLNKRLFQNCSVGEIVFLTFMIAVAEELLFRGILQMTFGYIAASLIFALVHVRYLRKPVLFCSVLLVSFSMGYLFEMTGNLLVTIAMHFTVDCLLGLIIRFGKWGL